MDNIKNDQYYACKLRDDLAFIVTHMKGIDLAVDALKKVGINKALLVAFKKNEGGNAFWESQGFTLREDLNYRNKALVEMVRIDPDYLAEEAEIEKV